MVILLRRIAFFTVFALVACTSVDQKTEDESPEPQGASEVEQKEELTNGKIYECKEIGWRIILPNNWKVIDSKSLEEYDKKGKEALETVYDGELNMDHLQHLVSFKKDDFNSFQSTLEKRVFIDEQEWKQNQKELKDLIYLAFAEKGIRADTSSSIATIDGMKFDVFLTTIYGPQGEVILYQELYSKWINGYDFGVNINFNNLDARAEMHKVWKLSTFRKTPLFNQ